MRWLVWPYASCCSLRLILKMLHSCEQFYCHLGKFYSSCTLFLVRPYASYCSLRLILKMLHSCGQFYCHLFTEMGLVHSMPMYIHGLRLSCFLHHVWLDRDLLLVLIFMAPCYSVSVFSVCLYFLLFLLIIVHLIYPFAAQDTNMINRARFLSTTLKV
jgi:hypothetical protein